MLGDAKFYMEAVELLIRATLMLATLVLPTVVLPAVVAVDIRGQGQWPTLKKSFDMDNKPSIHHCKLYIEWHH